MCSGFAIVLFNQNRISMPTSLSSFSFTVIPSVVCGELTVTVSFTSCALLMESFINGVMSCTDEPGNFESNSMQ